MLFYEDDLLKIWNDDCRAVIDKLPDKSIDLILTDPPYGIDFQSNQRVVTPKFDKIAGDVEPPVGILSHLFRVLKDDSAAYLFNRWDTQNLWINELEKAGFTVKNVLVWDKEVHGMGDLEGDWGTEHEVIIYAVKGRHVLNKPRPTSVIHAQKVPSAHIIHPNEKPVGVWYRMIRASTGAGSVVLDPYAGSCSSMLACRQLQRQGIGVELDKQWLEKILPRLNQSELIPSD